MPSIVQLMAGLRLKCWFPLSSHVGFLPVNSVGRSRTRVTKYDQTSQAAQPTSVKFSDYIMAMYRGLSSDGLSWCLTVSGKSLWSE